MRRNFAPREKNRGGGVLLRVIAEGGVLLRIIVSHSEAEFCSS